MGDVAFLPNHATLRITRRQAEDIVWATIRPEGAKHFDSVGWDTHSVTFQFRHQGEPGLQKVTVHKRTDGTIEVIR